MNLMDSFNPRQEELEQLASDVYRRAAMCYEQIGKLRDASECWQEAGEIERAAELCLRQNDHARAAHLLLVQGRYTEALTIYRTWLASVLHGDVVARVTAQLGITACLKMLRVEPEAAHDAYRAALELVERADKQAAIVAARCWEAIGAYGAIVERSDLVQLAYERALTLYGAQYNNERVRAAVNYLAAAHENRLLAREIEARIAEWTPVHGNIAQPRLRLTDSAK